MVGKVLHIMQQEKKSSAVNRSELGGRANGAPPPIPPLGTL